MCLVNKITFNWRKQLITDLEARIINVILKTRVNRRKQRDLGRAASRPSDSPAINRTSELLSLLGAALEAAKRLRGLKTPRGGLYGFVTPSDKSNKRTIVTFGSASHGRKQRNLSSTCSHSPAKPRSGGAAASFEMGLTEFL